MSWLLIPQILVALLLVGVILMQSKGTGLGSAWGGSGEFYRTKRGAERIIFTATIVLSVLFLGLSIITALV